MAVDFTTEAGCLVRVERRDYVASPGDEYHGIAIVVTEKDGSKRTHAMTVQDARMLVDRLTRAIDEEGT